MKISRFLTRIVSMFVCFIFFELNTSARNINLTNFSSPFNISSLVEYYETNDSQLTIQDIQNKKFKAYTNKAIHFSFSDFTRWFKITLISPKSSNWAFECGNPLIEYFDIFVPKTNKQFELIQGGCFVAKDKRNYESNHPTIRFYLRANEPKTIYVKIMSQRGFYTQFLVMPESIQESKSRSDDHKSWFFDGIQLFGNLLIALVAFLFLKANSYRVFAVYSFFISFTVLGYHESLGDFFTRNPITSSLINTFPYRILVIPEILLTFCLLPIDTLFTKWIKWYLYTIIALTLIFSIEISVNYSWIWVEANVWNSLIAELSILSLFAYAFYKGIKLEILFVGSFLVSFLGFVSLQLRLLQIIDFPWVNELVFLSEFIKIILFICFIFQVFIRSQKEKVEMQNLLSSKVPLAFPNVIDSEVSQSLYSENKGLINENNQRNLNDGDEFLLKRIEEIIENNISNSAFNITDLADELNMSPVQLRRKLKAQINQTTVEFIRNYRLRRAAELLKNRSGNISDVAFQVGFESLSYFTKAFQDSFGKTPSEWLKS